jgi:hypothetical protein
MKKLIPYLLMYLVCCFSPLLLKSQEQDAGLWLAAEGEVQLTKRFTSILNGEVRMHENMMEVGTFLGEAGVEYGFLEAWRLGAYYRFTGRQQLNRTCNYRHRLYADLRYRNRKGKHDWVARVRLQQQFRNEEIFTDQGAEERTYMRPKLSYRYRLNRTWRPFVSAELYFPVSLNGIHLVDKMRFTTGTRYRVSKQHSVSLYYMIQHEVNVRNPGTDFVIGIGYAFSPEL